MFMLQHSLVTFTEWVIRFNDLFSRQNRSNNFITVFHRKKGSYNLLRNLFFFGGIFISSNFDQDQMKIVRCRVSNDKKYYKDRRGFENFDLRSIRWRRDEFVVRLFCNAARVRDTFLSIYHLTLPRRVFFFLCFAQTSYGLLSIRTTNVRRPIG